MRRSMFRPHPFAHTNTKDHRHRLRLIEDTDDDGDSEVDFSRATLYLVGLQTVASITLVSATSVAVCWLSSDTSASAVRTLAVCTAVAAVTMRRPVRIRPAHGVTHLFACLQPSLGIYLMVLTLEQLVHTCSVSIDTPPSWLRVIFFAASVTMMLSGLLRARHPLQDTDRPFLLTLLAVVVVAMLPPPSVALSGPLCQKATGWSAAERIVRAFAFGSLYSGHVYASTETTRATFTTAITATRSGAACVWVLAVNAFLLPLAMLQFGIVIYSRVSDGSAGCYERLSDVADMEAARAVVNASPVNDAVHPGEPSEEGESAIKQHEQLLSTPHIPEIELLKSDKIRDMLKQTAEPNVGPRSWTVVSTEPHPTEPVPSPAALDQSAVASSTPPQRRVWTTESLAQYACTMPDS